MKKIFRLVLKIILCSITAILTLILVAIIVFWVEHNTSITLPKLTGSYAVGRTTFDWIDSSRTDSLAPLPNVNRELIVWIWYPTSDNKSYSALEYLPLKWQKALAQKQGSIMSLLFTKNLSKVHAHAIANPELSPKKGEYPVVFLKSGIGTLATDYTTLAEDLASHGYIVVGNDSPYSTFVVVFPDGRIIGKTAHGNPGEIGASSPNRIGFANSLVRVWSDDTKFILNKLEQLNTDSSNRFFGKLDMNAIGIFGHSFGGATAAQFCHDEPRCKAGIDMDGAPFGTVIQTSLKKPFMFLLANHVGESDSLSNQIMAKLKSIYNTLPESRVWINLDGAKHFNFSDMALTKEKYVFRLLGATGQIGGRQGLEITAGCVRTFFDVYLKGQPSLKIRKLPVQYSKVSFAFSM